MNGEPVLVAEHNIKVPLAYARSWFLELADHPERYQFDSHAGFTFTKGQFGVPGALFQTEERFAGIKLVLKFELTLVEDRSFGFRLRAPMKDIWGYFELFPQSPDTTRLRLAIGSDHRFQHAILRAPLVRTAVQHQINGEVAHIATSMTLLFQKEQER